MSDFEDDISYAEAVVLDVSKALQRSRCAALNEMKDDLAELRAIFKDTARQGRVIAGCGNWAEFCQTHLGVGDRAIRRLLALPSRNPVSEPNLAQSGLSNGSGPAMSAPKPTPEGFLRRALARVRRLSGFPA